MDTVELKPGQRIRIRQSIDRREGEWRLDVTGTIVQAELEPTGSWYAHSKDDKLWLTRIRLRKDNGELTTLTVDQHTEVELLPT
ncbi:MAG: hypothetical protein AB7Q17_02305 [Phycisphaerae bacterium]